MTDGHSLKQGMHGALFNCISHLFAGRSRETPSHPCKYVTTYQACPEGSKRCSITKRCVGKNCTSEKKSEIFVHRRHVGPDCQKRWSATFDCYDQRGLRHLQAHQPTCARTNDDHEIHGGQTLLAFAFIRQCASCQCRCTCLPRSQNESAPFGGPTIEGGRTTTPLSILILDCMLNVVYEGIWGMAIHCREELHRHPKLIDQQLLHVHLQPQQERSLINCWSENSASLGAPTSA